MMNRCPFCAILEDGAPATIVDQWREAIAIVPLNPVTPGHLLVIPRKHVDDATTWPTLTGIVMKYAAEIAADTPSANIITSIGAEATQTVRHLHVHVVPRRPEDRLHLPWTGQKAVGE
ncbi:HIT family protein [Nocardia sp. NPDC051833]|uniref:HIT family protein n=1 Tax=Nocardia sp. NPDC051833 TaxID=3155674 RepID=UPI003432583B